MAVVTRTRPIKLYRAKVAFGPYKKGATLQPTGCYRDALVRQGYIEEITDAPIAPRAIAIEPAREHRMIHPRDISKRSSSRGGAHE